MRFKYTMLAGMTIALLMWSASASGGPTLILTSDDGSAVPEAASISDASLVGLAAWEKQTPAARQHTPLAAALGQVAARASQRQSLHLDMTAAATVAPIPDAFSVGIWGLAVLAGAGMIHRAKRQARARVHA